MESISYPAFMLEAEELAKKNKRRPFVRMLNLLTIPMGVCLLLLFQVFLSRNHVAENNLNFLYFIFCFMYLIAIYAINSNLSLPVKVKQEEIAEAIPRLFQQKELSFSTKIKTIEKNISFFEYRLKEEKDGAIKTKEELAQFNKFKDGFVHTY